MVSEEWAHRLIGGWVGGEVRTRGGKGFEFALVDEREDKAGVQVYEAYEAKKGGKLRCLLLRRKKIFFNIYDVPSFMVICRLLLLSQRSSRGSSLQLWSSKERELHRLRTHGFRPVLQGSPPAINKCLWRKGHTNACPNRLCRCQPVAHTALPTLFEY